jgi:hypothetical protein
LASIEKDDYVCEYRGILLSSPKNGKPSKKFPPKLEDWTTEGNFSMFFRTLNGNVWCIDAANSTGPGRKMNHCPNGGNVAPKLIECHGKLPEVWFRATKDIEKGDELLYNYNETDPEMIASFPWLINQTGE